MHPYDDQDDSKRNQQRVRMEDEGGGQDMKRGWGKRGTKPEETPARVLCSNSVGASSKEGQMTRFGA